MNEAETKIVKQYIELAEDKYDDVKIYWADVRDSHEYEALKALVEDKPTYCEGLFSAGVNYVRCKNCNQAITSQAQECTKVEDKPDAEECSNIDNHAGYMHIDLEKCKVCGDKWVKPDAEGYAKYLADIERDYKEFSTVEEPKKPKKQTYEMWKVWYTIGELLETYIFLDEKVARRRAVELSSEYRRLRAITRADATGFYEGEGLENKED